MAKWQKLFLAIITVGYAIITLQAFLTIGPQTAPPPDSDTVAYLRMASLSVFDTEFLAGERSFLYAILLKLTAKQLDIAGYSQTVLSLLCWGFLAWSALHLMKTALGGTLAFTGVLLCATREEVLFWNNISLSESLSFSCFALWLGSWIMFARGHRRIWRILPFITTVLFTAVRDSNILLVLCAAILLALAGAFRMASRWNVLLSLALVAISLGGLASRSQSLRSNYSFMNNIGGRVLTSAWQIAEFEKLGMPGGLSEFERAFIAGRCGNKYSVRVNYLIDKDSWAVNELTHWVNASGQKVYLKFLMRNPGHFLFHPFREDGILKFLLPLGNWVQFRGCSPSLHNMVPAGFHTILPGWMASFIRGDQPLWYLGFWIIATAASGVVFMVERRSRRLILVNIIFLSCAVPHLLMIWHGDALDLPRHAVLVGIQVHLSFAMAFAIAMDSFTVVRSSLMQTWSGRNQEVAKNI